MFEMILMMKKMIYEWSGYFECEKKLSVMWCLRDDF